MSDATDSEEEMEVTPEDAMIEQARRRAYVRRTVQEREIAELRVLATQLLDIGKRKPVSECHLPSYHATYYLTHPRFNFSQC